MGVSEVVCTGGSNFKYSQKATSVELDLSCRIQLGNPQRARDTSAQTIGSVPFTQTASKQSFIGFAAWEWDESPDHEQHDRVSLVSPGSGTTRAVGSSFPNLLHMCDQNSVITISFFVCAIWVLIFHSIMLHMSN